MTLLTHARAVTRPTCDTNATDDTVERVYII